MNSEQQLLLSPSGKHAPYVLSFEEIDSSYLPRVGGKGANLGELTHAGLPVPPGFCITTEAYVQIAERADLTPLLAELSSSASSPARLAEIAQAIRKHILAVSFPPDLAASVRAAYLSLGHGLPIPVAVRSSATAEDLPFASFAGQQDTYLNILGETALLDAVRECWASLWTARAVSYRLKNSIDSSSVSLSVVVQQLIDVEVAGVLFTANPLTGRRRQAVIDASPGLGEAVVSGAVNPDHFVVDTLSGEIIERRLGDKRVVIQALPGGGTQRVEREGQSDSACLTDGQLQALAQLGAQVEAHYHAPQDTEWAVDTTGKLWLTQARPITTLYPLPADAPVSDELLRVYFSINVAQGVYQPLTPMGIAAFRLLISPLVKRLGFDPGLDDSGPAFLIEAGMRLFADVTGALRNPFGRLILGNVLPYAEARSAGPMMALLSDPRLRLKHMTRLSIASRLVVVATRLRFPPNLLRALLRPEAARHRVLGLQDQLRRGLSLSPHAHSLERLNLVEQFGQEFLFRVVSTIIPVMVGSLISYSLASRLLGDLATADERQTVLRSLPFNPTTQMDLALWDVAQTIAADPTATTFMLDHSLEQLAAGYQQQTLPPVLQTSLATFLAAYGHRGVAEIDLGLPRWSNDPSYILGALLNYLRLKDQNLAPTAQFERGAQQAEAMVGELTRRATKRNWLRGQLVKFGLRRTRALAGLREQPKFYLVWTLARMRELLHPVGEELASSTRLEKADDIYFLSFREVRTALAGTDLRSLVSSRRAIYEQEMLRRHVPRILLSDGSEPAEIEDTGDDESVFLRGTPASSGRVTARARVILNPVGAHLEPGEVLVAPSTDPGWTPLFLTAGALVMEMGGAMSHGAVVAREYGIPAVVGVAGATERLQDGQLILVDGSTGKILLAEAEANSEQA